MKTHYCSLCEEEAEGSLQDDRQITCWRCVQKLYNMTNPDLPKDDLHRGREKLKTIHRLLIEKGFKEKAKLLVNWITEEVLDEPRKHKPNMERERPGRAVSRALQGSDRTK